MALKDLLFCIFFSLSEMHFRKLKRVGCFIKGFDRQCLSLLRRQVALCTFLAKLTVVSEVTHDLDNPKKIKKITEELYIPGYLKHKV